jgi:hypothetical protein
MGKVGDDVHEVRDLEQLAHSSSRGVLYKPLRRTDQEQGKGPLLLLESRSSLLSVSSW